MQISMQAMQLINYTHLSLLLIALSGKVQDLFWILRFDLLMCLPNFAYMWIYIYG